MKKRLTVALALLLALTLLTVAGVALSRTSLLTGLGSRLNRDIISELYATAFRLEHQAGHDTYGGVYYTGMPWNPQLHVLVTDPAALPEPNGARVHVEQAAYSEAALIDYHELLWAHYYDCDLLESGLDVAANCVTATFKTGTDLSALHTVIPAEAIRVSFDDGDGLRVTVEAETDARPPYTDFPSGQVDTTAGDGASIAVPPPEPDAAVARNFSVRRLSTEAYHRKWGSLSGDLRAIRLNVEAEMGEELFAGAAVDSYPREPQMYVFVTDLDAVPEVDHPNFHYVKVKYSWKALNAYRDILFAHYDNRGLMGMGTNTMTNRVSIEFADGTDLSELYTLIPEDAVEYVFVPENYYVAAAATADAE